MNKQDTNGFTASIVAGTGSDGQSGDSISTQLKQFYHSVEDETLPDRFMQLLDLLGEAERRHLNAAGSGSEQVKG